MAEYTSLLPSAGDSASCSDPPPEVTGSPGPRMCDEMTSNGYDHNLVRDDRAANIRRVPSGDTVTSPSGPAPVVRRSADSHACVEGSTVTRQRLRTCSESPSKNRYRPDRAQEKWPSVSRSSVSCRS